jgi:ATP-binding cassette subfamily F protein 3
LLSPCNFLILDEPTNHLDIQSKEVLKQALLNYEGTFIIVSHDREFLDGLTNRIWDIQDKTLKIYHYDVKEYLAKKLHIDEPVLKQKKQPEKTEVEIEKPKPLSQEETKDLKRKRNSIQNNIKKFEEKISSLETKISEMDSVIANLDYTDSEKSSSILNEYEKLKKELENVMSYWELEMEALDNLNG